MEEKYRNELIRMYKVLQMNDPKQFNELVGNDPITYAQLPNAKVAYCRATIRAILTKLEVDPTTLT